MLPFVLVFCFPFVWDHHVSGVVLIGSYASLVAFLHCRCSDAKMAILIVASRDESEICGTFGRGQFYQIWLLFHKMRTSIPYVEDYILISCRSVA